jgi:hypothetical protein
VVDRLQWVPGPCFLSRWTSAQSKRAMESLLYALERVDLCSPFYGTSDVQSVQFLRIQLSFIWYANVDGGPSEVITSAQRHVGHREPRYTKLSINRAVPTPLNPELASCSGNTPCRACIGRTKENAGTVYQMKCRRIKDPSRSAEAPARSDIIRRLHVVGQRCHAVPIQFTEGLWV